MQQLVVIRGKWDRVRYTCLFEFLLLLILAPAGAVFFERQFSDIGVLSVLISVKAMILNLIYNWVYDKFEAQAGRVSSDRSFVRRIFHAIGFEVVLITTSVPILVWWLGLTIGQALLTDVVISTFVVVFALFFTWAYDVVFPVRQPQSAGDKCVTELC